MVSVWRVSTREPVDDVARTTRAELARHDVVVLLGRPAQARQIRRIQAALRAGGYRARYLTDGTAHQLVVTADGQEMPRSVCWWGGLG